MALTERRGARTEPSELAVLDPVRLSVLDLKYILSRVAVTYIDRPLGMSGELLTSVAEFRCPRFRVTAGMIVSLSIFFFMAHSNTKESATTISELNLF